MGNRQLTREQIIELLRGFQITDIIKAFQAAYQRGYDAGWKARHELDDDIPF